MEGDSADCSKTEFDVQIICFKILTVCHISYLVTLIFFICLPYMFSFQAEVCLTDLAWDYPGV